MKKLLIGVLIATLGMNFVTTLADLATAQTLGAESQGVVQRVVGDHQRSAGSDENSEASGTRAVAIPQAAAAPKVDQPAPKPNPGPIPTPPAPQPAPPQPDHPPRPGPHYPPGPRPYPVPIPYPVPVPYPVPMPRQCGPDCKCPDHDICKDGNCKKNYVVVFTAKWCGPCKIMKPRIKELGEAGYIVYFVDVDDSEQAARKFNVSSLPTTVVMENGKELDRFVGIVSKDRITRIAKTRDQQSDPYNFRQHVPGELWNQPSTLKPAYGPHTRNLRPRASSASKTDKSSASF
jgi:thioredoxin 1